MTAGQLSFDGREVSDDLLKIFGDDRDYSLPEAIEVGSLRQGDRVKIETEYVVVDVHYPKAHNKRGVATDQLKQVTELKPVIPDVVEVRGVLREADIQDAWDRNHGAEVG